MKTEDLKAKGLTDEQIAYVFAENGKDIKREQDKVTSITEERDKLKGENSALTASASAHEKELEERDKQLTALKSVDAAGLQAKIVELEEANKTAEKTRKKELDDAQKAHAAEIMKMKRETDTREFMGKHKFVNELTRDALMTKLESALDDPVNAGKSRQELLDALVAGEDGKPRTDIFAAPPNPNQVNIPPVGTVPEGLAKYVPPKVI